MAGKSYANIEIRVQFNHMYFDDESIWVGPAYLHHRGEVRHGAVRFYEGRYYPGELVQKPSGPDEWTDLASGRGHTTRTNALAELVRNLYGPELKMLAHKSWPREA